MNFSDFLGWESIATFGGASAVTALFTQLLKGATDRLPFHIPTRLLSYLIALIVLLCTQLFTGMRELSGYALCFINAAIVSTSSNGAFEALKSMKGDHIKNDLNDMEGGGKDEDYT